MTENTPDSIAHYSVSHEIGRGGMGVVYLARDTRLNRDVAIKTLPHELSEDAARLERFEREARTLASLNHPNLAGIHGLEEQGGIKYLILEYVDGETLEERIDHAPLPVEDAVEIACQIAAGVEAAHEAGVIHRDLKPANIKITSDGQAKVLDFGLARVDDPASSSASLSQNPTLTSPAAHSPTIAGVILGTAAYMSPEQARGRRVDKRTDIWAFGVILYEMLTGASPFCGETVSDSIAAVLHKDIDASALPRTTPAGVRRVIDRCLVRDKSERYRDIGDVRLDLRRSLAEPAPEPPRQRSGAGVKWGGAALVLIALLAAVWAGVVATRPIPQRPVARFDLKVESEAAEFDSVMSMISPDGAHVAYILDGVVQLRDINSFDSRTLTETHDAIAVFWSPDSQSIVYYDQRYLYKLPLAGGAPLRLTTEPLSLHEHSGGGWTADNHLVVADTEQGIMQIPARGGAPTVIVPNNESIVDYHDVSVVPGTNTLLYVVHQLNFSFNIVASDGEHTVDLAGNSDDLLSRPTYAPSGHVLYAMGGFDRDVWAVPFTPSRMETSGEPFLAEPGAWTASVSNTGDLVVLRGTATAPSSLVWVTSEGDVEVIDSRHEVYFGVLVSPDASKIAFSTGVSPKFDIWVHDTVRRTNTRITFSEQMQAPVAWSPDGSEIVVIGFAPGTESVLFTRFLAADGSGETRPTLPGALSTLSADWTLGAYVDQPGGQKISVKAVPLDDTESRSHVVDMSGSTYKAFALSPDGSLLLYTTRSDGEAQIYCTRFPSGDGRWQISTDSGIEPTWSSDGTRIMYCALDDSSVYAVDVTREPTLTFSSPRQVLDAEAVNVSLENGWSMDPNGERFLATRTIDGELRPRSISLIQSWYAQFNDPTNR